jgi:translation initiation factor IF-1
MLQRLIPLLIPLCFLFGGLALIVDYFAPPRQEAAVVESLSTWSDMEGETTYEAKISGGELTYCHVDSKAHAKLRQGDRIEVRASHLFDSCTRIVRDGELVYRTRAQPLVALVFGVLLFVPGLMVTLGGTVRRRP